MIFIFFPELSTKCYNAIWDVVMDVGWEYQRYYHRMVMIGVGVFNRNWEIVAERWEAKEEKDFFMVGNLR